ESLEIRKARGDKRGEAEVLLFLADLYKNRSDTADHQIYEWLSAAFKIADEIQAQDLLSKACYNLHEYYSQKGNHKDSLIQLEAHLQIEKELHKNTINQKVANLEISHKAEVISERNRELIELNEKIETANAELRIEASLERVRAVAMGMKEPADMINVCRMISDQLQQLGFKEIRNVQTAIIYPQKHEYLNYQYFTPYDKESIETINYWLHPDVLEFTNQMLSSPDAYYHKTFQGEELSEWREYRKKTNQLPDPKLDKTNSSHYYFYSIGSGALGVTTYAPLNEGQIGLFKRFRNVFELAYRRFIDIEKALAQAREAQIEAALERVRAKSMAMHHSDDLITVINVVQEQLLGLGFHFHGANFVTDYSEKGYTMWLASPSESFPYKIYVPQIGQKYFEAVKEAIEKGSDFATYSLNFEEKNTYFKNLFENSLAKNTSEQGKRMVYESKGMAASVVLLDKVRLNLMNLDMIPFTDEENNILRRFGWVFEQSYTRFLDLQKAEAQAREAQIETGLERVRSKTMAMHKSEEVTDVAVSLNEELLKLGFEGGSTIIIMDKETGGTEQWTGFSEDKSLKSCYVPYFKHPCHDAQLSAWKKGEEFLVYTVTGDEKRTLDEHYFTTGYKDFPESDKRWMRQMESVTFSHAFMKYGAIHWGPGHLTEEQLRILQRFSKVFEQSYTRFLDLQKAEAQARDAQIEAALERVRSRTMGMHKSDELPEAANLLFQQIQALDIPVFGTGYNIWEDDKKAVTSWMSSEGIIQPSFSLPLTEETSLIECYEAGQKGDQFFVQELSGAKLFSHLSYMQKLPVVGEVMKKMAEAGLPLPEYMINHHAFFSHGYLLFITYKPVPDAHDIFKRFAKVFDQTYTRFLDLQKAEAQAREAQIELALERVRARAMAMQNSEELKELIGTVFTELTKLDLVLTRCVIMIYDAKDNSSRWWMANSEDPN
ncbi:MAG TPA: hypothetical protein VFH08_10910, partial [Chitinophagaceae bacterium]|nr:hypothetical protein [Chitinophagaceae bacterium]